MHWTAKKKFEAMNEKKVSKKKQNAFIHAFHVMRDKNLERDKLVQRPEEGLQEHGSVESVQGSGDPAKDS